MPAKPNTNNKDANSVLFQKGKSDEEHNTLWDDSELIVAWTKQLNKVMAQNKDGERTEPVPLDGERGVDADPETPTAVSGNDNAFDDGPIEFAASGEDEDDEEEEEQQQQAKASASSQQTKKKASSGKRQREDSYADAEECSDDDDEEALGALCPPLPKGVSPAVASMLRAWYEAGYRTGLYVGAKNKK